MDWFSSDPNRPGVFAAGQEATGVFVLGQSATGVIAIGQLARGVVAIGQGACGIVAVGQGALGVVYSVAMLGVAARGVGGVLQLVPAPKQGPPIPAPVETPLDALRLAGEGSGWVQVTLERTDGDPAVITADGKLDVASGGGTVTRLRTLLGTRRSRPAYVRVAASRELEPGAPSYRDAPPVRTELQVVEAHPWQPHESSLLRSLDMGVGEMLLRGVGLAVLATAWWLIAGRDILAMFRG